MRKALFTQLILFIKLLVLDYSKVFMKYVFAMSFQSRGYIIAVKLLYQSFMMI